MAKYSVAVVEIIALVIITCMLAKTPGGEAVITCNVVVSDLIPCATFIKMGGKVSGECCSGLKTLVNSANTKDDRQATCFCIKTFTEKASDDEIHRAAAIPTLCGVQIPFQISRNMDCSKVNI